MGQGGSGGEGIWTIHCAGYVPVPDQAGGGSQAMAYARMARRARRNGLRLQRPGQRHVTQGIGEQAPVGSPYR
jgi:hypothetical protein